MVTWTNERYESRSLHARINLAEGREDLGTLAAKLLFYLIIFVTSLLIWIKRLNEVLTLPPTCSLLSVKPYMFLHVKACHPNKTSFLHHEKQSFLKTRAKVRILENAGVMVLSKHR